MRRTDWSTCVCGKRGWRNRRDAERVLDRSKATAQRARRWVAQGKRSGSAVPRIIRRQERRVYECPFSGHFHLTSTEERA